MPKSTRAVRRHHHRPESLKCHCPHQPAGKHHSPDRHSEGKPNGLKSQKKAYTELKTFGAGRDIPARDWQDYLLQMLQMGYFEIAYNENNHLKITGSGSDVLFGREKAMLVVIRREEPATAKRRKKSAATHTQAWAEESRSKEEDLFEALRALRKQLADQEALPAYIVLSDKVLHLLCLSRPTTVEAFGNINGIGEYKKKKYGKDFVALIRQFV